MCGRFGKNVTVQLLDWLEMARQCSCALISNQHTHTHTQRHESVQNRDKDTHTHTRNKLKPPIWWRYHYNSMQPTRKISNDKAYEYEKFSQLPLRKFRLCLYQIEICDLWPVAHTAHAHISWLMSRPKIRLYKYFFCFRWSFDILGVVRCRLSPDLILAARKEGKKTDHHIIVITSRWFISFRKNGIHHGDHA